MFSVHLQAYDKMGANPTAQAASQFVMEMWKKYFEAAGHSMVNQSVRPPTQATGKNKKRKRNFE